MLQNAFEVGADLLKQLHTAVFCSSVILTEIFLVQESHNEWS